MSNVVSMRQRFITTRPNGDDPSGASIDTWETLAARASQLSDSNVTAADLIAANVGVGATSDQVNAWLISIGGALSGDGVNYIFPANLQVNLPNNVTVPGDADAAAVDAAAAAPAMSAAAPEVSLGGGPLVLGALLIAGVLLLGEGKPAPRKRSR